MCWSNDSINQMHAVHRDSDNFYSYQDKGIEIEVHFQHNLQTSHTGLHKYYIDFMTCNNVYFLHSHHFITENLYNVNVEGLKPVYIAIRPKRLN